MGFPSGPPPQWGQPPQGPYPAHGPYPLPGQPLGRPTGPSVGWAVVLWCVAAACLGAAVLFGIIAATGLFVDRHMDNNGVTTSATVTDVDDTYVTVEFLTEDNESAVAEFVWWPEVFPAVNDEIQITYDPDDPSYATQAGSNEDQILGTVLAIATGAAIAAAAGAGVGAMFVHRARRKAAQSGGLYYY